MNLLKFVYKYYILSLNKFDLNKINIVLSKHLRD